MFVMKLHGKEFALEKKTQTGSVMKSGKMRLAVNVAGTRERIEMHTRFSWKNLKRKARGIFGVYERIILKLNKQGWIHQTQERDQ
jgi:hypothetical protein